MPRTRILYRFTIGNPLELGDDYFSAYSEKTTAPVALEDYYDSNATNSYIFTNHQCKFKIVMNDKPSANVGFMTLYNLDEDVIGYLQENSGNNLVCILEAGDNEQGLKTIYRGTVSNVKIRDDDTDNQTKITITDGGLNIKSAFTVRGYPRGTPWETVIRDLCSDMKLPLGVIDGIEGSTPAPISLMGDTHSILQDRLLQLNIDYSIQNSTINIIPQTRMKASEVSVITAQTGLIGRISPVVDDSTSTNAVQSSDSESVSFKCLLDGSLAPTETVYLQDREFNGAYKLTSVVFHGDFEGNMWICECIAKPTTGVLDG